MTRPIFRASSAFTFLFAGANPAALSYGIAVEYIPQLKLSSMQPQPAPDAEMTKAFKTLLENIASSAADMPQVTPELNTALKNVTQANRDSIGDRLKKEKSFDFLMRKDIKDKKFQRLGVDVASVWFYRLITQSQTYYYTFYLTADKKIAHVEGNLR